MKVIDIHTHTFPNKIAAHAVETLASKSHTVAFTDGTLDSLIHSMGESGISISVVQPVATRADQVMSINNSAMKINSQFESIISFGAIHPDFEDYESELKRIAQNGIKGIKIHPVYQDAPIDDERYIKILECAGKLNLITLIHSGYDIGFPGNENAMPQKIFRAMKSSGNERVILAHMGGWRCWNESIEFLADTHAYIDTAFSLGRFTPLNDGYYSNEECMMLSDSEFIGMIRAFGAERVIFGTDSPWASQSECVKMINDLPLENDEKELIFSKNALSLIETN